MGRKRQQKKHGIIYDMKFVTVYVYCNKQPEGRGREGGRAALQDTNGLANAMSAHNSL